MKYGYKFTCKIFWIENFKNELTATDALEPATASTTDDDRSGDGIGLQGGGDRVSISKCSL